MPHRGKRNERVHPADAAELAAPPAGRLRTSPHHHANAIELFLAHEACIVPINLTPVAPSACWLTRAPAPWPRGPGLPGEQVPELERIGVELKSVELPTQGPAATWAPADLARLATIIGDHCCASTTVSVVRRERQPWPAPPALAPARRAGQARVLLPSQLPIGIIRTDAGEP